MIYDAPDGNESIDMAKAAAFEAGASSVYAKFDAGVKAYLPEDHPAGETRGHQFTVSRMYDSGDRSVGIQPWECYVVTPQPDVVVMRKSVANALRDAMDKIAHKPIGRAEATDREVIDGMTTIAREALEELDRALSD